MKTISTSGSTARLAAVCAAFIGMPFLAQADVVVSNAPTANMTCSAGVCAPTSSDAVLNAADLESMLAGADLTVQSNALAPNIRVDAPLNWASAQRLTLDSYLSIYVRKPLIVAGTGSLTITTSDGNPGGDFWFTGKGRAEFPNWQTAAATSLIVNGHPYALVGSMRKLVHLAADPSLQYLALAGNIDLAGKVYSSAPIRALDATLEGLGNSIANLKIIDDTGNGDFVGLVGETAGFAGTAIRDLNLLSVDITGWEQTQTVGAVAGMDPLTTIQNVFVSGTIAANGLDSTAGALAGQTSWMVVNCRSDAAVSAGSGGSAGGLVGGLNGSISASFSTGSVSATDNSSVGGLVGDSFGSGIEISYSLASVTGGANSSVGGLMGKAGESGSTPMLAIAYATGSVTAGSGSSIGGLIGTDFAGDPNVADYWDLDTSGVSNPAQGAGNVANERQLKGLTTAQFTSRLPKAFKGGRWLRNPAINGGYPYLADNPPN